MSHMMLKEAKSAADIESKRKKQAEIRMQLDEQVRIKSEQKKLEKQNEARLIIEQKANTIYFDHQDALQKEDRSERSQRLKHDIMRQMEQDANRRHQEKTFRTAKLKPLHSSKDLEERTSELEECPVLSTLGTTIRYISSTVK